jgi:hypothetical protein
MSAHHLLSLFAASLICASVAHARPAKRPPTMKSAVSSQVQPTELGVSQSCTLNGKKLWGKVEVVKAFPDFKVQKVQAFPDLKVQKVQAFPDSCGKWQFVKAFPDFKIQFVQAFPDLKVQFVTAFPGVP